MRRSALTSSPDAIICPLCEAGELCLPGDVSVCCDSCVRVVGVAALRTLEEIVALPDVLGKHACECGHPEMRRLPDSVFHCPACGLEVLSLKASSTHA